LVNDKIFYPTEEQWIALSIELVEADILECQMTAFEFLWKNKKAKSDKQAVIRFLQENNSLIHSRVKREVETKLRTGKKNG